MRALLWKYSWPVRILFSALNSFLEDADSVSLVIFGIAVIVAYQTFGMRPAILVGACLAFVRITVKGRLF